MLPWNPSPYAVALLVMAVAVAVGIAPVAWQRRRLPGGWVLLILSLAAHWWAFTPGLELGASGLSSTLWVAGLESIGMVSVPLAWFSFISQYTGHGRWRSPRRPAAMVALAPDPRAARPRPEEPLARLERPVPFRS